MTIKLSDIEEAFKTLKYKSPIISVDDDYVTIQVDTGWLIISKEKYEKIFSKIHH
jgi:hypothetical protein